MSRPRRDRPVVGDVRAVLIAKWEEASALLPDSSVPAGAGHFQGEYVAADGRVFCNPWRRKLDALRRGEAVEVYAWELSRSAREQYRLDISQRCCVEVDGSVTPIAWQSSPRSTRRRIR